MDKGKFFDVLVLMVLENTGWGAVQGCKFVEQFRQHGTTFTHWIAATHPSGPNYRTLLSGQTWSGNEFDGVQRPNLAQHVDYKVFAFRNEPAIRHNPFLDMNPNDPRARTYHSMSDFKNATSIMYLGMDDANNAHSGPLTIADDNVMAAMASLVSLTAERWLFTVVFDEAFGVDYFSNHVFAGMMGTNVPVKQISTRLTHGNFAQFLADNWSVTLDEIDPYDRLYAGHNILDLP